MIPSYIHEEELKFIISRAADEDLGEGDHSTLSVLPPGLTAAAKIIAKGHGIIAGTELAQMIFGYFSGGIQTNILIGDGEPVNPGDCIIRITGDAGAILSAERLVLNFMQRMSGIATETRKLVNLLEGTGVKLLDTRKTTPLLRKIEKWSVLIGGGYNHRFGLYDMILLKDNHIDFCGGISKTLKLSKEYRARINNKLKIEIETRTLEEVQEVLDEGGADIIMLDNMDLDQIRKAVKMINNTCMTEASGNISENTIRDVALCGVDYISAGMITHSAKSIDLSLISEIKKK